MQGIALGHQNLPREGSQRRRTSQWMLPMLKGNNLTVVKTPITHTKGAALDVHITDEAWRYKARTYAFQDKLSDHSMSIVDTDMQVAFSTKTHLADRHVK